jgi:hypothetical protein
VISDLVTSDVPVGDESIICVIQGSVVGHLGRTAIWIYTVTEELVDGINGVGLYRIVGSIDEELGDIALPTSKSEAQITKKLKQDDERILG